MVVCSCNVISDKQIYSVVAAVQQRPPTVSQVYVDLGCRARCGRCAPTIKKLRDEASRAKIEGRC
jgi:bacterioferritin-associated ferredoxin